MIIEATISRPAAGGEFIAEHDGRIVFVTGGLVGEKVYIEISNPDVKLWRGTVVEIIEPSPHRIPQMCAAAEAGAGCCDWGVIAPSAAAEYKQHIVLDCLKRIGHFAPEDVPPMGTVQLEPLRHWRTRARLGIDAQGRAGLHKARSNDLVIDELCSQNAVGLTEGLNQPGVVNTSPQQGNRRRQQRAGNGELFVAIDTEGHRHAVHVRGRGKNRRENLIEGTRSTKEIVRDVAFDIPVTGFWQAHRDAADFYASRVAAWLSAVPGGNAWDLYGGVGVLAVPLAELVGPTGHVISVEEFPAAAKAGRKAFAAGPKELATVTFHTGDVATVVRKLAKESQSRPNLVVCDPPRSGAGAKAIATIAQAKPQQVFHLGCDPATFARDARSWVDNGYTLRRLEAVDAFPGTHHVEVLALFEPAA